VIDGVGTESGAHQLLEHVGFLVGTLGRAEAGHGLAAVALDDDLQAARRSGQGLFPGGFAEMAFGAGRVDAVIDGLGRVVPADQGHQ